MKSCTDSQCNRKGQLLPLSEFYRDSSRTDGREYACKQCKTRKTGGACKARKRLAVQRKPSVKVYSAIERGFKTREQIETATGLDEELIADALAELWDRDQVRVVAGEFYPLRAA